VAPPNQSAIGNRKSEVKQSPNTPKGSNNSSRLPVNSPQHQATKRVLTGGPLCIIDLQDFAQFAAHWLDGPCVASNGWCGGADLNQLNDVDIIDLGILASEWLNVCPSNWHLHLQVY
jgi:hypothetical protein